MNRGDEAGLKFEIKSKPAISLVGEAVSKKIFNAARLRVWSEALGVARTRLFVVVLTDEIVIASPPAVEPVETFVPAELYRSSVALTIPAQIPCDHEASVRTTVREAPLAGLAEISPIPIRPWSN